MKVTNLYIRGVFKFSHFLNSKAVDYYMGLAVGLPHYKLMDVNVLCNLWSLYMRGWCYCQILRFAVFPCFWFCYARIFFLMSFSVAQCHTQLRVDLIFLSTPTFLPLLSQAFCSSLSFLLLPCLHFDNSIYL